MSVSFYHTLGTFPGLRITAAARQITSYSVLSGSDKIIIIKRGEKGYFKTDIPVTDKDKARSIVNEYNTKLGVSRAQEEAMKAGSMFGFQVPAADPRNYDADGKPVMPKDRGDAR